MIKHERASSVSLAKGKAPSSPVFQPMPTTGTASRIVPNGITAMVNEARPGPRLGSMSVNPGRPAGER
jgi:hypothetical protein